MLICAVGQNWSRAGAWARFVLSAAILPVMGLQAGCFCLGSGGYFYSGAGRTEEDRTKIEFDMGNGRKVTGRMVATETIVFTFVPLVPVVLAGGNPYHLELSMPPEPKARVVSATVETPDGRVLLKVNRPEEFTTPTRASSAGPALPVFSANARFEGRGARHSSRNGWSNSRPVPVPRRCEKLVLRVRYRPGEREVIVPLKSWRFTRLLPAADDMYLATGDFPAHGWAEKGAGAPTTQPATSEPPAAAGG